MSAVTAWAVVEGSYDALKDAFSTAARGSPPHILAAEVSQVLAKIGMMAAIVAEETAEFVKGALLDLGCSDADQIEIEQLGSIFNAVVEFQACFGCSDEERQGRFPRANGVLEAETGTTPLLQAVSAGDEVAVRGLLKLGALADWPAYDGTTPLYAACQHGQPALAQLLLAARAEPDATVGRLGSTPLGIASLKGHLAVVEVLAAAGAALDLPSKDGSTALYAATRGQKLEVGGHDHGAARGGPAAPCPRGCGPVCDRLRPRVLPQVVIALLAARADPSRATNKGLSPLHRACALPSRPWPLHLLPIPSPNL